MTSSFYKRMGRNLAASLVGFSLLAGYPVVAGSTAYQYDALGRVTQALYPDGTLVTYQYDKAGNRIQASKSPPIVIDVTAAGSNLRTLANNAGYTGTAGARYKFVVLSGLTLRGGAGGGNAIDTGTWPSDAVISLFIRGNVYGGGGNGGTGCNAPSGCSPSFNGGPGGHAINAQAPISITVLAGASLKAGGGGGGGGGYNAGTGSGTIGGDGGGGGFPNGLGGAGSAGTSGDAAAAGAIGTDTGGGAGGSSGAPGGTGGGPGAYGGSGTTGTAAGGAGGANGCTVRKNGYAVSVTNNGGTVSGSMC